MNFPKLNELTIQQDGNYKRHSVLHNINNTFLRNTILQNNSSPKLQYQSKLTSDNFIQKDLIALLKHLFNKLQLSITDRNLIRRILLTTFNQNLIWAGGKQFINHLKFRSFQRHQKFKPTSKQLYFILKGNLTVSVCGYSYKKKQRQSFGQLQLLSSTKIQLIQMKSDVLMLSLTQDKFNQFFRSYFVQIYQQRQNFLAPMTQILKQIPVIYKYLIFSFLQKEEFKTGDKIVKKGQILQYIYFTSNVQISNTQNKIINQFKAIGLYQLSKEMSDIKQNMYCMENKALYKIKLDNFKKFVPKQILTLICSSFSLGKSQSKQKVKNQENPQKIQNFVRIRKVRFNQKRRIHTQNNETNPQFMTSFIFIKDLNEKHNKKMINRLQLSFTRQNTNQKHWLSELTEASPSSLYSFN